IRGIRSVPRASGGSVRSRSAISSSSGSRHNAIGGSSIQSRQVDTLPQGAALLQARDNAPGRVRGFPANRLDHGLLKLLDDPEVDQRAGDLQLQAELMPHFARQLEDHVDEGGTIRPLLAGLRDGPGELLVDNLLNAFKSRGGA